MNRESSAQIRCWQAIRCMPRGMCSQAASPQWMRRHCTAPIFAGWKGVLCLTLDRVVLLLSSGGIKMLLSPPAGI